MGMIKRFSKIRGKCLEKIYGQDRLAFSHSDTTDFYDMIEWAERGGYKGSVLAFYDFENGNVYIPFETKRNVLYSDPAYADGFYYFLRGDFGKGKITLYRYLPEKVLEPVTDFKTNEVELYNLRIVGSPLYIISQEDVFHCYYPIKTSFPLKPNESVVFIEDGKVYLEAWIEEGWDDENDCATEDYRFYNKVIVKDMEGNTLSEEIGSLNQASDGTYWMA